MRVLALILLNLTLWSLPVEAQLWSSVLDPARAIDWTTAGAGPIPTNRTQCGSTIAPGASAATINAAIAACPANQFVSLGAGTFNLSSGLRMSKDNVTLRGAGADQTFLVFSGSDACGGGWSSSAICIMATTHTDYQDLARTATWTASFAKGTKTITLSSTTNLSPGSVITVEQFGDATDTGNIWVCGTGGTCTSGGGSIVRNNQMQANIVQSVNGNNVTLVDPIFMPNWSASHSPLAFWNADGDAATGIGVENLSIDATNSGSESGIVMYYATYSWVKGVRLIRHVAERVPHANFLGFVYGYSAHNTIRDSYYFGRLGDDDYAIDCVFCSANLTENNIFQHTPNAFVNSEGNGNVYGYNYVIYTLWGNNDVWAQASYGNHNTGISYDLLEGNDAWGYDTENYFGQVHFGSILRNHFIGREPAQNTQTAPIRVLNLSRYMNVLGNILGVSGYHNNYQVIAVSTPGAANATNADTSIYWVGIGGNGSSSAGGGGFPPDDFLTAQSLFRWGNWDVVTQAAHWCGNSNNTGWTTTCGAKTEVPSAISPYGNAIPASETLPNSFYLSARPSAWWKVGSTIPPWPPIGPDVTGGTVTDTGGHAYKIPARLCFETVMGGTYGDTAPKTFNAASCYSDAGGGNTTPPAAPTGLKVQ